MMEKNVEERIKELVVLKITNRLSEEQSKELDELKKIPGVDLFIEKMTKEYLVEEIKVIQKMDDRKSLVWDSMRPGLDFKKKVLTLWQRMAIAASFVVVIAGGAYLYYSQTRHREAPLADKKQDLLQQDILPPEGTAILTLADGRKIDLKETNGRTIVASQGKSSIVGLKNELVYTHSGEVDESNGDMVNTVTTGIAGMYKLTLEDGTQVWLNSNSTLEFYAKFSKKERRVKLIGQGYFDIAQDKGRPFLVEINNTVVKVLGTRFDINMFNTDRSINTTLFSGAIIVEHNGKEELLQPGQQVKLKPSGQMLIGKAPEEEHSLAWLRKKFSFQSASIESIMDELSRNYKIKKVIYEGKVKGKFNGIVSKRVPLSEVLRIFSATDLVEFELIDGNTIVVKP